MQKSLPTGGKRSALPDKRLIYTQIEPNSPSSVTFGDTFPRGGRLSRPPVRFKARLNQATRSEPRDNLGKVRAIRCGSGAGAPGKINAPCVRFDGKAFAFCSFYYRRGCPCLENRFAEQTGKTVKRGFGDLPKTFLCPLFWLQKRG